MVSQFTIQRVLIVLAAACLLSASFLGIAYSNMNMSKAGDMPGCPFMGEAGICRMTPFEHVAAWQNMFTSTPQPFAALTLLMLIALFALGRHFRYLVPKRKPEHRTAYSPPREIGVFDPLKLAFARGIIHPKIL